MEIEFDPAKEARNLKKHGISLSEVERFEWDSAVVYPDERYHYDEFRECAIGYIGNRLYHLSFVERFGKIRPISLRRAILREVKFYANS